MISMKQPGARYQVLLLLILLITGPAAWAQTATIKGRVITSDNQPAPYVTITVAGTNRNAITNEAGFYTLAKLQPGEYELEASFIGYETLRKPVAVTASQTLTADFQISISNSQLQEVIVTNSKSKFVYKSSEYVARMPLRNLENPQVYNVVGRALIQEQVIIERTDLYRNIPGSVPNFSAGGSMGLSMRGFLLPSA